MTVVEVQTTAHAGVEQLLAVGCEAEVIGAHQTVRGVYLGEAGEAHLVFEPTAGVVAVGSVARIVVHSAGLVDPSQVLLIRALAAEAVGGANARRMHAEQIDRIVEVAHEEANDRGWCSEFDDLLEDRLGLPRREREYSVRARYSGSVTVTVTASSEDEALGLVGSAEVRDAMQQEGWAYLDIDVDDTDID